MLSEKSYDTTVAMQQHRVPNPVLCRFKTNCIVQNSLYSTIIAVFFTFSKKFSIDLALVEDPKFKIWAEKYYKDEEFWFKDFANYYQQLNELGLETWKLYNEVLWYKFW